MKNLGEVKDFVVKEWEQLDLTPKARALIMASILGFMTIGGAFCSTCVCSKSAKGKTGAGHERPVPTATVPTASAPAETDPQLSFDAAPTQWDEIEDYKKFLPRGEFSPEERLKRTQKLPNGVTVFRDMGVLTFYMVEEGDNFERIKSKLSANPEFAYVRDLPPSKLKSFNIPLKELKKGMWIPIPLPEVKRQLTPQQLLSYSNQAIDEMLADPTYSEGMKKMLAKIGRKEVLAEMYAIGKHEAGGVRIGENEYHRWEGSGSHHEFSFSLWHVLMTGPGLRARRNLNLTEGQTYHPKLGAKAHLAYLLEKLGEENKGADAILPISEKLVKLAVFYNGSNYRKEWVQNVPKYYREALGLLNKTAISASSATTSSATAMGTSPAATSSASPESVQFATESELQDLKNACLHLAGSSKENCQPSSKLYPQNERMLKLVVAEKVSLPDATLEHLRSYYCDRMTQMIDRQYAGTNKRPAGKNWRQKLAERQQELDKICECGE